MKKNNVRTILLAAVVLVLFLLLVIDFPSSTENPAGPTASPEASPIAVTTPDPEPEPTALPTESPEPTVLPTEEPAKTVYTMADYYALEHTELFPKSTLEHLFLGTVKNGNGTGYHYDGIADTPGSIIEGTKSELDAHGVYNAKVIVNGHEKKSNKGYSSFFPESYSPQDVIDAINDVYDNCEFISGNLYAGLTEDGIEIDIALRDDGKIITAYPIWEGQ